MVEVEDESGNRMGMEMGKEWRWDGEGMRGASGWG